MIQAQNNLSKLLEGPKQVDVNIARAQVRQAQLSQLQAENSINNARLLASFDGVISQVNARQAIEGGAGIEAGCVGLLGAAGFRRQGLPRAFVSKGLQMRFDLLIALGDLLVIEGIQLDRLASGKQVFGAPGALERL
ncbi:hypothetical protein HC776_00370, partial [bacterium]|nr:hypothetical protein [bacterium]